MLRAVPLLLLIAAAVSSAQTVDLAGTWRIQSGDDLAWARPDFDDSSWQTTTLPRLTRLPVGRAWLRRTVTTAPAIPEPALTLGILTASVEIWINGERIGATRDFGAPRPPFFRPEVFPIPPGVMVAGAPVTIALRSANPSVFWGTAGSLRDEGPYRLINRAAAEDATQLATNRMMLAMTPLVQAAWAQAGISAVLLLIWRSDRSRIELLWFALFLVWAAVNNASNLLVAFAEAPTGLSSAPLVLAFTFLSFFSGTIFRERQRYRLPLLTSALGVIMFLGPSPARAFFSLLMLVGPLWWSLRHLRDADRPFAIALLVYGVGALNIAIEQFMGSSLFPSHFYAGPFQIWVPSWVSAGFAVYMLFLLLRRVAEDRREQDRLSAELEAAKGVQRPLLGSGSSSPHFETAASYIPASELGGDFYFLEALPSGALTAAVGDVSGKGVRAALIVSMVTAILRREAAAQPSEILAALNQVLIGSVAGGFVTCTVLRCEPDGQTLIANAGHLPPWRNGAELPIADPGLPLGVMPGLDWPDTSFHLAPGDQLTLLSDGVVEACNPRSELLGFARTGSLTTQTAAEIATTARDWGQNDDITAVTIRRTALA